MSSLPIRCFCSGYCPHGQESNGTTFCRTKPGGYCFASVQEVITPERTFEAEWTYGCLPPEEQGHMQCQGYLSPHTIPRSIKCCSYGDLCNINLKPSYISNTETKFGSGTSFRDPYADDWELDLPHLMMIVVPSVLFLVGLIAIIFHLVRRYRSSKKSNSSSLSMVDSDSNLSLNSDHNNHHKYNMYGGGDLSIKDITNSSGAGVPTLVQRTIANEINFIKYIGGGRFGQVFHASWRGDDIAVKMFKTTEEASWKREHDIFNTVLLRHENILRFFASDIRGTGGQTQMLLITEYHPNGSLFDFLTSHSVDEYGALKLIYSSLSGLCHLHQDINQEKSRWDPRMNYSTNVERKPAIAHRDIKSKNILVKADGTCCIADFGLCVLYKPQWSSPDVPERENGNIRVGTKRYMAPEVLDSSLRASNFESFKQSDIYSFSLVLWEILRRTRTDHGNYEGYSLPYAEDLPCDPSFNDMIQVVCEPASKRPQTVERWSKNEFLEPIVELMVEGWSKDPKARPTARRMKRVIGPLFEKCAQEKICDSDTPLTSPITGQRPFSPAKYLEGKRMGIFRGVSPASKTSDYETDRGTNGSSSSGRSYGGFIKKQTMARETPSPTHEYTVIKEQSINGSSDGNEKKYFKQSRLPWMENQKNLDGSFIV